MKHAMLNHMIIIIVILALHGCTTAHFLKTGNTTYPPYNGNVRILDVPLEGVNYEVIGIVSAYGPWNTQYDSLIKLMQKEAALNGADAIMICSDAVCPRASDQCSSLAAPAIKILPMAAFPQPEPEQNALPPALARPTAPTPSKEKAIVEKGRATLNIHFDTNKASVKDQYLNELAELSDVMKKYPDLKVMIEGHTDSIGNDDFNMKLSQKRADSVKDHLVRIFGIDASRLEAIGYGETRPVEDNNTMEGRQMNRRVEAVVEYEKTL